MSWLCFTRRSLLLLTSLFILASCGGSEDPATAASATPTLAAATPAEEATSTPATEAAGTATDDRTEQEIAVDRLDLMMVQLGIEELDDFEDGERCVIDRLESEGIEFTGEGTAELIALSACNDTIISQWLPSTNPALPDEVWACTVESIGEWIGALSIADAEAFFGAASPPEDFIAQTAERCNANPDDIATAL